MGFVLTEVPSRPRPGTSAPPKSHQKNRSPSTHVVSGEVVDGSLGKHGVVLKLTLAERRSVGSDDNQLGLAGLLVIQLVTVHLCCIPG